MRSQPQDTLVPEQLVGKLAFSLLKTEIIKYSTTINLKLIN